MGARSMVETQRTTPDRKLEVVFWAPGLTSTELAERLGPIEFDEIADERDGAGVAVMVSKAPRDAATRDHFADLWSRASVAFEKIAEADPGTYRCLVRLVQYVRADDDFPGFTIEPEWVKAVAAFDGFFDIDQYIL